MKERFLSYVRSQVLKLFQTIKKSLRCMHRTTRLKCCWENKGILRTLDCFNLGFCQLNFICWNERKEKLYLHCQYKSLC